MSSEIHQINPLTELMARRQYSRESLYKAALRDPRFSSGFGMYPPPLPKHPKTGGSVAWVLIKFGLVGGLGIFLNQAVLFALTSFYDVYYLISAILSSQVAVLANFALNNFLVFRSRMSAGGLIRKVVLFNAVSSSDLVVRIPLLWGLTNAFGLSFLYWANLASILLTFGGRFLVSEKKIWAKRPVPKDPKANYPKRTLVSSDERIHLMDEFEHWLKFQLEQLSFGGSGKAQFSFLDEILDY